MREPRIKTKSLLLLTATLLLLMPPVWSVDFSQVTVVSEGGITLTQCSTNEDAAKITQGFLAASPGLIVVSLFIRAGPGRPECFEYSKDLNGQSDVVSSGNQLTIDLDVEANQKDPINLNSNLVLSAPAASSVTLAQPLFNAIGSTLTNTGNAIIMTIHPTSLAGRAYFFQSFGGFSLPCNAECATCNGGTNADCLTCRPDAKKGADIDPSLAGRCICLSGKFNSGTNGCSGTCAANCKSCLTSAKTDCLTCPNDTEWTIERRANGVGECSKGGGCHETCATCSGPGRGQCLTCKDISPAGQLSLASNNECRCPAGQYYVAGESRCSQCDSSCHSCEGPSSDKCLICSDPKFIVNKSPGLNTGPCVNCADPGRSQSAECRGKAVVVELLASSPTSPTTLASLSLDNFEPVKAPVRVPNRGKHIVRLSFPKTIIERIALLGDKFVFSEFMSITISGLATPGDYSFTGALNEQHQSYDLTFNFVKDHDSVIVSFQVIQNNYFLLNLPTVEPRRRRSRRELQSFSATNQQLLDGASLVQVASFSANVSALSFNGDRLDRLEELGIHTRLFFYITIFLFAMGLMMTMLASKYDGRIIGRFVDVCFFIGYLSKVPFMPAGWTAYDLTFFDQLVMTDTLLMTDLLEEKRVRTNLRRKFKEYSIPVLTPNNATYTAPGFILALLVLLVVRFILRKRIKSMRVCVVIRTFAVAILAMALPSTYFYSGLSAMRYAFDEGYSLVRRIFYYAIGFFVFVIALGFIIFLGMLD